MNDDFICHICKKVCNDDFGHIQIINHCGDEKTVEVCPDHKNTPMINYEGIEDKMPGPTITYLPLYKGFTVGELTLEPGNCHGVVDGTGMDVVTFASETFDGLEQAFKDSVDDYLAFKNDYDKGCFRIFKEIKD